MRLLPPPMQATTPRASGAPGPATAGQTTIQSPAPAAGSLEGMRAQAADLAQQLAGLKAQRVVMERQLRSQTLEPPARAQLAMKKANIEVQIAQVEIDLANVRAQIAARQGVPVERIMTDGQIIVPPPQQNFNPRRGPDPDMVVAMTFALLMIVAIPSSIAFARRIWRGKPQPVGPKSDEITPRLDRLEHAVDAIAIEIERISEGQRFVTKVLAERPMQTGTPAGNDHLALGAGPAEPVRVSDRQSVRQVITPH